jgi:hypothetical protein
MCVHGQLVQLRKNFSALYIVKCLGKVCVVRLAGEFPDGIKQPIELNAKKAEAFKGTTMAAWLVNLKDSPNHLAVRVYDNKPVHVLLNGSFKKAGLSSRVKFDETHGLFMTQCH